MSEEDGEGLVTLKEWAARCGYSHGYVVHVMPRHYPDFPAPERTRRGASTKGGGGGSNLYHPAKLVPFEPHGPDPVELAEQDLDKEVTPSRAGSPPCSGSTPSPSTRSRTIVPTRCRPPWTGAGVGIRGPGTTRGICW